MRYKTSIKQEAEEASLYFAKLLATYSEIELKKVSPKRSLNQNNYFHLLLGAFGLETGLTIEEAKTVFKRDVNPYIFVYEKNGSKFLKSSADLSTKEMSDAVDKFIHKAADIGVELPLATDQDWLRRVSNEIDKQGRYL